MEFSNRQLINLIRVLRKENVSKFNYGDLKIEINTKKTTISHNEVVPLEQHGLEFQPEPTAIENARLEIEELELENLMLSDPVEYERRIASMD